MTLLTDIHHAFRSVMKSRGYAAACIALLALGIGANTAIFALLDSIILKPLPYPESERLVFLWNKVPEFPEPLASRTPVMRRVFEAWRGAQSFTQVEGFIREATWESGVERPEHLRTAYVSEGLLSLLGAKPTKGRLFRPDEMQQAQNQVVLISDSYFTKRFNRDPNIVGRTLGLDNVQYTVTGVLPPEFRMPATFGGGNREQPDVFVPFTRAAVFAQKDGDWMAFFVPAKLKPGVSIEQARAEIAAITEQVQKTNAESFPPFKLGANVFSIVTEDQTPGVERQLRYLLVAVGFFLLIACANLANLALTRIENRAREIAVRRAIGASRWRIVRHLALESVLLSAAGTAVGLVMAIWLTPLLLEWAPDNFNRPEVFAFRWPAFVFAALVGFATTVLFGLLPAFMVRKADPYNWLKSAGHTITGSWKLSRHALTAIEIGFSIVLLVGAGLMVRTLINFVRTPLGIDMDQLAVVQIELPQTVYPDEANRQRFLTSLTNRIADIPGVQSAAVTTTLPMAGRLYTNFAIEGNQAPKDGTFTTADYSFITPGYFKTVGIPIVAGRDFSAQDVERNLGKGDGVALINQMFVRKFLTGNPLGRRLVFNERRFEIVGVTADFSTFGPANPIEPQSFRAGVGEANSMLVMRTTVRPDALTEPVREAFWSLDKSFVPVDVHRHREAFYALVVPDQMFALSLLGAFGVLGLVLAMTGVYSVLSHLVASRRREIGIRIAVGASTSAIGRMVAQQSVRAVIVGIAAGVLGSFALTRFLEATLFQVSPRDPLTVLVAVAAVVAVIPLALWVPVRRAMRVECAAVLREE